MSLVVGTRLGPYEIQSAIGAGGMGEVYKARDTRLDRTVAIKVLPPEFSADPERRARFEREARAVAALNHPHICTVHDVGEAVFPNPESRTPNPEPAYYLVMELLAGETLAARLERGPLLLAQALDLGAQIADALDAAHKHGIVHRDLKPANVMLAKLGTSRSGVGTAKLLDFGLAKLRAAGPMAIGAGDASTRLASATVEGTLLGTLPYMAPEQLEGRPADPRTDIWALGCLLYEMASGRRAFGATSQASLIGEIMAAEPPPLAGTQPLTPPAFDRLVRTCLAKDPDGRWQAAADVRRELQWLRESGPAGTGTAAAVQPRPRRALLTAGLALVTLALMAGVWAIAWFAGNQAGERAAGAARVARFTIPLDVGQRVNISVDTPSLAVSADGTRLAWIGGEAPDTRVFTRALDSLEVRPIRGTDGTWPPFLSLSPDGNWVVFPIWTGLHRVPVAGGDAGLLPKSRSEGATELPLFTDCSNDGILFNLGDTGIRWMSEDGTSDVVLTKPDPSRNELSHGRARALPGGRRFLFNVLVGNYDVSNVEAFDRDTGRRTRVLENAFLVRYVPTGHLVFAREGSLIAVPFDLDRLEKTGGERPVLAGLQMEPAMRDGYWDVSQTGTLAYVPDDAAVRRTRLFWVDRGTRTRQPLGLASGEGTYSSPSCGLHERLAYGFRRDSRVGLGVWFFDGRTATQITDAGSDSPVWKPDDGRLAFASTARGHYNIHVKLPRRDAASDLPRPSPSSLQTPLSFSSDGRLLLFADRPSASNLDLRLLDMDHPDQAPLAVAASPTTMEGFGRIRPQPGADRREAALWVAYTAQDGKVFDVFVRKLAPGSRDPGTPSKVSTAGGAEPVWSPDGNTIYYRSLDGKTLYSVAFFAEQTPPLGLPEPVLNDLSLPTFEIVGDRSYDISTDGRRFLMVFTEAVGGKSIVVVQNWFEELKAKVPAGGVK